MKFTGAVTILSATLASATSVSYDIGYDDGSRSITAVSCSDGVNGLITKYGWRTQGAIPKFPYIGGSSDIAGWNSAACGNCYKVTYNGNSINVLAIDHATIGINMSEEAMNALTNNQAETLGRVDATVEQVGVEQCGLTPYRRTMEFDA